MAKGTVKRSGKSGRTAKPTRAGGSRETLDSKVSAIADIRLAQDLKKYTHQIWLAGLGAFTRAENEGGKMFDTLVQAGEEIETRTRDEVRRQLEAANSKVEEVRTVAGSKVEEVKSRATDTWDKVEKVFDDRVSRALKRLGVPTRKEIEELNAEIDRLKKELAAAKKSGR